MGWLSKYDDSIIAQGGETISLSREDYLRQQYQVYLKEQAEKGRKAVVEGREKFAKDYVIPAIKTASSFTPAGPLIGLADAYEAYQQGNTGWALAGAGMEALPYVGKVAGKAAPIVKTASRNLKKDNLKTLIYNNISPASYTGKKEEIKNLVRDIMYIDNPTIHDNPIRKSIVSGPNSNDFYGLDSQVANRNRNDAWKLYLGIDDKGKSLYDYNSRKGTYNYNSSRISDESTYNFLNQYFDKAHDLLTSNAGGIGDIKIVPSNYPDVKFAKMRDTWDLQPFKEANRSLLSDLPFADKFIFDYNPITDYREYKKWVPDKLKNLEIGEFLGVGKPFTVEHSVPYTESLSYGKSKNWWEQFGRDVGKLKVTRNRVTDRIVYEKPDYSELFKTNFTKTFQGGGEIKSYDDSFKANVNRGIGKIRSKVPKSFWILPGMSDIDDVLYAKQAFSDQGTWGDKIISTAGLALPYISTKALKALPIGRKNYPYEQVNSTSQKLQQRGAPAMYAHAVAEANWNNPLLTVGDKSFYRGVHLPVVPGGKYVDDRITTPLRPVDVDISSQGFKTMEEYAIDPDLPKLQGIDAQNINSGNYYHNGLWTTGNEKIANQYARTGRFKVTYNELADKVFKDPNSTKVVYRDTYNDMGDLPVGMVQEFKPIKTPLYGIEANDNISKMMSKFYNKPASEISLQEGRDFLNRARIDFTSFPRQFEEGFHFLPGRITPTNSRLRYEQGGTIPKAQEGTTLQRPYIAKQDATKVLLPLTKKVNQEENEYYNPPIEKGITSGDKRLDFLYNNQWLFDVPIVNDYIRKNAKELASISALGMVDDVEEFKELAKKNNLSYSGHGPGKGLISQYFDQDAFPPSKYKPTSDYLTFLPSYSLKANFESDFTKAQRDDYVSSFIKEGLTSKNDVIATEIPYNDFIKNKKPVYNRYPHANLVSLGNPDLGGHKMGAAWDYTVDLPYVSISDAWDFEPVHYTKAWAAYESEPERQKRRIQSTLLHKAGHPFKIYDRFYFDPKTKEYISDDSIQTLKREKGITPLEDEFLNKDISKYFTDEQSLKKFAKGGSMSYTPEYIEQLKQFENRPDNLAYHLDNKKIPTIGWGHRITEEELKRKAIKMGKEWIPYEKFSGKEGRQYADRLMELDVAHHYNRLERQVGKDTLATLPPEVHDVLLDITYNRGSLGDSLEYVKSGDIAGLRDYLAETSKGLKGGAKTRMEWRANRIPIKTLPPVESPIHYTPEDKYVPEVLQSIAEQPSTQDIIPIQDNEGYRNQENYGKPVQITSNQSTTPISMQGVPFPILAMSDTGELKIMFPGEEHEFEGGSVTEVPMAKKGGIIKSKQLRTFTEDNGWLNKYKEQ